MINVMMFKEQTVAYSTIAVGDCFAYNGNAYLRVATGCVKLADNFNVTSLDSSTQVIPYPNSVVTLN